MAIPTVEPLILAVGDSWEWEKSLSDYPADDGWSLSYYLINSTNKITVSTSASGAKHVVDVPAATTAGYTAGDYKWYSYITKGADRYKVDEGEIEITPDVATVATLDTRTKAQEYLALIDSLLAGHTSASYTISTPDGSSRTLNRHDRQQLEDARTKWQAVRNMEIRRERSARGLGHRGNVKVYL